ncbi:protein-glutamate O-methyltransferase CheR [Halobaculum sp. MBLA0147]|uniref:CheR family methyltransferase n=1 Tax=Halobaculum sp. MBLA0147 TaxID=3079934 RepID=UPI00352414EA
MSGTRSGDDDFDRVIRHIEDEVPFEPGYYNEAYLGRRISARMQRRDADDHAEYLQILRSDESEREELLDALTINVTGFFRDPDMWDHLVPVLRDLTADNRRVEAWSAPCADGREPYSLQMVAEDDDEITARRLNVSAVDISEDAIAAARAGVYETTRTTDIEDELGPLDSYEPYVEQDGNTFRVRDRIREQVSFDTHDLIRDEPAGQKDLLLCRNLLIYIDAEYKTPLFETLQAALRDGGYLVLGKTESVPPECRDAFEPVAKRSRIYRYVGGGD